MALEACRFRSRFQNDLDNSARTGRSFGVIWQEVSMKMLTGLAGIAIMAVATPAAAYNTPPEGEPTGTRGGGSTEVPSPPVALLFGLAAGAILVRRKIV